MSTNQPKPATAPTHFSVWLQETHPQVHADEYTGVAMIYLEWAEVAILGYYDGAEWWDCDERHLGFPDEDEISESEAENERNGGGRYQDLGGQIDSFLSEAAHLLPAYKEWLESPACNLLNGRTVRKSQWLDRVTPACHQANA